MQLVTGGAGFIGSHIVRALNQRGERDILVVDNLENGRKFENLRDCQIADYLDKREFMRALEADRFEHPIDRVFHQGACTDTLEEDGRYLLDNNFRFSKLLLEHCLANRTTFVYASSAAVYGQAMAFRETPDNERPLNVYGYSKLVFDQYVRRALRRAQSTVVGLRYFNVYGPHEAHKGRMASMVHHVHRQLRETGVTRLYEGQGGFDDGEQRRDFVYVDDVVRVNLFFGDGPLRRGIFNVGSGRSWTFNELARKAIALHGRGKIEYVPLPTGLLERYQTFTEADLSALRRAGYTAPFTPLEEGIARSIPAWEQVSIGGQAVA